MNPSTQMGLIVLKCGPLLFEGGSSEPSQVQACYTQQNNVIDSNIILFVLC